MSDEQGVCVSIVRLTIELLWYSVVHHNKLMEDGCIKTDICPFFILMKNRGNSINDVSEERVASVAKNIKGKRRMEVATGQGCQCVWGILTPFDSVVEGNGIRGCIQDKADGN